MGIWQQGGFFRTFKNHVIKWWRVVFLPVFHLNNNHSMTKKNQKMDEKEEIKIQTDKTKKNVGVSQDDLNGDDAFINSMNGSNDAKEILACLEREKLEETEKNRKNIEELQRKRMEEERIAKILNSNKICIDQYIERGKENREDASKEERELEAAEKKKQDDLRRAQEIIERLNREAAEDAEKKQNEIEEAKRMAEEKFK